MKPLEKLNLGTLVGTISEDIVRINLELYQLKINELIDRVNQVYEVPENHGSSDQSKTARINEIWDQKVSDLEKEKTIQKEKPKKR